MDEYISLIEKISKKNFYDYFEKGNKFKELVSLIRHNKVLQKNIPFDFFKKYYKELFLLIRTIEIKDEKILDFLIKTKDIATITSVCLYQKLSDKFVLKNKEYIDFINLASNQKMKISEKTLEELIPYLKKLRYYHDIKSTFSYFYTFSEDFIERNQDFVHWPYVYKKDRRLSEEFIEKFITKPLRVFDLFLHEKYSFPFIKKLILREDLSQIKKEAIIMAVLVSKKYEYSYKFYDFLLARLKQSKLFMFNAKRFLRKKPSFSLIKKHIKKMDLASVFAFYKDNLDLEKIKILLKKSKELERGKKEMIYLKALYIKEDHVFNIDINKYFLSEISSFKSLFNELKNTNFNLKSLYLYLLQNIYNLELLIKIDKEINLDDSFYVKEETKEHLISIFFSDISSFKSKKILFYKKKGYKEDLIMKLVKNDVLNVLSLFKKYDIQIDLKRIQNEKI